MEETLRAVPAEVEVWIREVRRPTVGRALPRPRLDARRAARHPGAASLDAARVEQRAALAAAAPARRRLGDHHRLRLRLDLASRPRPPSSRQLRLEAPLAPRNSRSVGRLLERREARARRLREPPEGERDAPRGRARQGVHPRRPGGSAADAQHRAERQREAHRPRPLAVGAADRLAEDDLLHRQQAQRAERPVEGRAVDVRRQPRPSLVRVDAARVRPLGRRENSARLQPVEQRLEQRRQRQHGRVLHLVAFDVHAEENGLAALACAPPVGRWRDVRFAAQRAGAALRDVRVDQVEDFGRGLARRRRSRTGRGRARASRTLRGNVARTASGASKRSRRMRRRSRRRAKSALTAPFSLRGRVPRPR